MRLWKKYCNMAANLNMKEKRQRIIKTRNESTANSLLFNLLYSRHFLENRQREIAGRVLT